MKEQENELLEYYKRELSYLRKQGEEFAKKYPKIAGRLEFSSDEAHDPHIERLIESFAFLSAKIQRNIDEEFTQLGMVLLGGVSPQLLCPIPSMSIAQFSYIKNNYSAIPMTIPRNHPLTSYSDFGERCRFRTCYPVELYPLKVSEAAYDLSDNFYPLRKLKSSSALHIKIEPDVNVPPGKLKFSSLRFFINGDKWVANLIYELLFTMLERIEIVTEDGRYEKGNLSITPVGFNEDEEVIPYPPNVNAGYRLLQEYFSFPDKFLFFDLNNIELNSEKSFSIYFIFKNIQNIKYEIGKENFKLGCTPVINLFEQISEPIRIDQLKSEYKIIPDSYRENITEIYSVNSVSSSLKSTGLPDTIDPYFSYKHYKKDKSTVFWFARRQDSENSQLEGSDMLLSLIDLNYQHKLPEASTLYATLLCTNRKLADFVTTNTFVESENKTAEMDICFLKKPTSQVNAPINSDVWRLASSLSLNYLSLGSEKSSLDAFKELLNLYDFANSAETRNQLAGIISMQSHPVVTRLGNDNWKGFSRGIQVSLEFDTSRFTLNNAFLFASVINRFLPLYVSINSFTQLIIKKTSTNEIWKKWKPRIGQREIL